MRYAAKIAVRHLASSPGQSALLVGGVAVGVMVFVFMSALLSGLVATLTDAVLGDVAHVSVEPAERLPTGLYPGGGNAGAARVLLAVQRSNEPRAQVRAWAAALEIIEGTSGVRAASALVAGSGFVTRGQVLRPVALTGVEPERLSAIARVGPRLVAGRADLGPDAVLLGVRLAADLGVGVGQTVTVRSERGQQRALTVGGIFRLGNDAADAGSAYVNLRAARALLDLPQGVSRIEVKLRDPDAAEAVARRLGAATGLKAVSWVERDPTLRDIIASQTVSTALIKGFALLTVMIGVASALLLSTYRRRAEIGIMRATGASTGFVLAVFLLQGAAVGLLGGAAGAGAGFGFMRLLLVLSPPDSPGGLPNDPAGGGYLAAVLLTTFGATAAALLPARAAARVEPVSVLGP